MSRTFTANSVLGDQLQFRSMTGFERMGYLFEFTVRLLSQTEGISAKSLLGTDMTIAVDLTTEASGGGTRYLSGQVAGFSFTGRDGDYYAYQALLRPWLWLATRRSDFKIFQNMTVPDIVQQVLAPYGFMVDNKLTGSYRTWEYCVQYGETDFNFVSRLLEHEGAYFYFQHQNGSHHLVLADSIGSHSPLSDGPTTIPYYPGTRAAHVHDEDFIDTWAGHEAIASGRYEANDYDFTKPRALLDTHQAQPAGHAFDSQQIYRYPGGYTDMGDGDNYARARIEQLEAQRQSVTGWGNARNLAPGYLFTLEKYPDSEYNQQYLIESASYAFTENVQRSDGGGSDSPTTYRVKLAAVPSSVRYRVKPHIEKPHSHGPDTAVVVGPAGEEIYTDEYGRVKVQFFWDRYGTKDENSSCWIRVSQVWAGTNYGAMHIPRIGQEVIVDYLHGDPDYPIITGRVYNAMQMPPWSLPANKTQSGIKTNSSLNGASGPGMGSGPGAANALRFEDMAGSEQLWLHAQKDQLTEVENDETKWVGNDRDKTIDGNETNVIHKNRTETVDLDETINIHGNRTETVDKNETITIHQNRTETVDLNEAVTIHQNQSHTVDLNRTRNVGVNETVGVGVNQALTVGVDRTKSVGVNESDTIGSTWSINVGMMKTQNIGMAYVQNVALAKVLDVGGAYVQNVAALMATTVGIQQVNTTGVNRTDTVGQNQTTNIGQNSTTTVGQTHTITAKKISINATDEITLTVGSSAIKITNGNIQVLSPDDRLNC